jgi:hypothetical protein
LPGNSFVLCWFLRRSDGAFGKPNFRVLRSIY